MQILNLYPLRNLHHHVGGHQNALNTESIANVADALVLMSKNMNAGPNTPQHCKRAINIVYDDGDFSNNEASDIMVLFATDISFADTFADIPTKNACSKFICKTLASFN
jgi:hypothetical protein